MRYTNLILLVLLFTSCSAETDEAGTNELEQISNLLHTIELSDSLVTRIGEIDYNALYCDEQEALIIVSSDNNKIVVTNMEEEKIAVFGGEGSGPAEFESISAIGKGPECDILVHDPGNGLIKKFSFRGELLNTYQTPTDDGIWMRGNYIYRHDGQYYFTMEEANRPDLKNRKIFSKTNNTFDSYHNYGEIDKYYINYDDELLFNPYMTIDQSSDSIITTQRLIPYFKIYDINNEYEQIARYGHNSSNFRMSDDALRRGQDMETRLQLTLEKSLSDEPFVTRDYLIFRFSNNTEAFLDSDNLMDRDYFISIYDKNQNYEFITEVEVPYHPIAVYPEENQLFFLDTYEVDDIEIGVYEIDHQLSN